MHGARRTGWTACAVVMQAEPEPKRGWSSESATCKSPTTSNRRDGETPRFRRDSVRFLRLVASRCCKRLLCVRLCVSASLRLGVVDRCRRYNAFQAPRKSHGAGVCSSVRMLDFWPYECDSNDENRQLQHRAQSCACADGRSHRLVVSPADQGTHGVGLIVTELSRSKRSLAATCGLTG